MPERTLRRFAARDLALAWFVATAFSGAPSTAWAWWIGGDLLEATRAAGAMLLSAQAPLHQLIAAAALVHGSVSAFWALVFAALLPHRYVLAWSVAGAAAVAMLDLQLIAPRLFPEVAALAFWPQFADHLAWGALLGGMLAWRKRRRSRDMTPG